MNRYGIVSLSGMADSQKRENFMKTNRFEFKQRPSEPLPPPGRICPGCNLRRAVPEFQAHGQHFRHCVTCRARNPKLRKTV